MKPTIKYFVITIMLFQCTLVNCFADKRISDDSILDAGYIYGFAAVCTKEGYALTDKSKAFLKLRKGSKLFSSAAAAEMKGYSENYCRDSFNRSFGKSGALAKKLGFSPANYVAGDSSEAQQFAIISAAEIAYMEKVCSYGVVLTPDATIFVKSEIKRNRTWFSTIYMMAAEEYGSGIEACEDLSLSQFNINSEKTKRLNFQIWEEECPAAKLGQAGCKAE